MSTVTAIQSVTTQPIAPFFTPDQEQMILRNFLGGATKEEAAVLLEIVKRRRLDPFARQVYFVKRWDSQKREEVWAIQTSIDGLRGIAERSGQYDGQDEPIYGKDEAGEFCKVKVYRKDWSPTRYAMGIAYLSEFIQKKKDGTVTSFWQRMPRLMLAKCAEALAIRKAFPEDTAGLYIPEEMGEEKSDQTPAQGSAHSAARAGFAEAGVEAPAEREAPASPSSQPPSLPPKRAAPPPYVLALFQKLVKTEGTKELAQAAFKTAAESVFGDKPKPSNEWTTEDAAAVEAALYPKDIPF